MNLSFVLVDQNKGIQNITRVGNSYILSYPCEDFSKCTEYTSILPKGKYKLEVWGAEGGTPSKLVGGGKGGYSQGTLTITKSTIIFVSIGSKGGLSNAHEVLSQKTFGGGGSSSPWLESNPLHISTNGGGGTDIRVDFNDLFSRIIVGGGGGGTGIYGEDFAIGGYGGGISGNKGANSTRKDAGGFGGTHTAGGSSVGIYSQTGSFGIGGSTTHTHYWGCGGGGGWYGGSNGNDGASGGGGGSGYVLTKQSYIPKDYKLNNTSEFVLFDSVLKNGAETFMSPFNQVESGHLGNGFAKITIIDAPSLSSKQFDCNRIVNLRILVFSILLLNFIQS